MAQERVAEAPENLVLLAARSRILCPRLKFDGRLSS
jgi:hypothetical protein